MSPDVLVIGAGPSGLFATHELARLGAAVRIVERDGVSHREARGTALQPGTLELLDLAGIVEPFLAAGVHVRKAGVYGPELELIAPVSFEVPDCDYPYQCQLPQWRTEEILAARLAQLGVEVERGVEVLSVDSGSDHVVARLRPPNGDETTVEAAYAVGAGGAHSITRHGMDEQLEGATYPGRFLVAEIAIESPLPPGESGIVASNDGLLLIAPLPEGRFITFSDLEEEAREPTRRGRRPARRPARRTRAAGERSVVPELPDAPADRAAATRRPSFPDRRRGPTCRARSPARD